MFDVELNINSNSNSKDKDKDFLAKYFGTNNRNQLDLNKFDSFFIDNNYDFSNYLEKVENNLDTTVNNVEIFEYIIDKRFYIFNIKIDKNVNIYVNNNEDITLDVNNNYIFKYLPLNRKQIMYILSIPNNLTTKDFLSSLQLEIMSSIEFVISFFNSITNTISLVIKFRDQNSTDNFFYNYSGKSFFSQFELLYCCYVNNIYTLKNTNLLNVVNKSLKCTLNKEKNIYHISKIYQLPSCPICIESLESYITKINTISFKFQNKSWPNFRKTCTVCKYNNKYNDNNINKKCFDCDIESDNWCCMICGYTGCNRYNNGHALKHYYETNHRFSLLIQSEGIWDYEGDCYVHKVNQNEYKNLNSINNNIIENEKIYIDIDNSIFEYNSILEERLDQQRKYYEKEIEKININNDHIILEYGKRISDKKIKLKEINKQLKLKLDLIREYNKKSNIFRRKLDECKDNINFTKDLSDSCKTQVYVNLSHNLSNKKNIEILKEKLQNRESLKKNLEDELELLYSRL